MSRFLLAWRVLRKGPEGLKGKSQNPIQAEIRRFRMLAKFCKLEGKAKEIELEWQRIQQDEHDFHYAFQVHTNGNPEHMYLYKKGIADGVKWCIKNFC